MKLQFASRNATVIAVRPSTIIQLRLHSCQDGPGTKCKLDSNVWTILVHEEVTSFIKNVHVSKCSFYFIIILYNYLINCIFNHHGK